MNHCLLAILLTAAGPPFEAQMLDGRTLVGPIVEIGSDRVAIETSAGTESLATDALIRLSPRQAPTPSHDEPGAWIELADGSSVVAVQYTADEDLSRLLLQENRTAEIPTGNVTSVRLKEQPGAVADEWARILSMKADADLLVTRKGNVLNYHRGVLRLVTDEVVSFELDGEVLPVKRSKVHGLIYHRTGTNELPETICRLGDAGGSQWSVSSLHMPNEDEIEWTTPGGATVGERLTRLMQIDFSQGKVVYLSDLEPESVNFTPYFGKDEDPPLRGRFLAPRRDTNLESNPLTLGAVQYAKGLAIHSRTEIVYRLPGRFSRLQAVAGIDDSVRPHGNVRLVISGDDKQLLESTLTGTDPPRPIDLDLSGVRRVTVLVDFGAQLGVADHLDLCNARVIK